MWVNPRNLNVPGLLKRALASAAVVHLQGVHEPGAPRKKLYEAACASC
jgi:hypothetical protein